MNRFRLRKKEYLKNLDGIIEYIAFDKGQKKLLNKVNNEDVKDSQNDIYQLCKQYEGVLRTPLVYNAIIISIYGCYEAFIDKISNDLLDFFTTRVTNYYDLSEKLRNKHIRKSGEFLSNSNRFRGFETSEREVINNLQKCLGDDIQYELNKELLMSHGGNLRVEQLIELLSDFGIQDSKTRILNNPQYVKYIAEKNDIQLAEATSYINSKNKDKDNILFEELEILVEQRNKVAHGWCVDTRISYDIILNRIITFMKMIGEVLCGILEEELVLVLKNSGMLNEFNIIDVFNNSVVCLNCKNAKLKVGDFIVCRNENRYKLLEIMSIQCNKNDIEEISEENLDVGIRVDSYIKKNWSYYYIDNENAKNKTV